MTHIFLAQSDPLSLPPGQFALWIGCAVTFIMSIVSFVTAYRLLTKNFVTHDYLKTTVLELEQRIDKAIENSRHILRGELQAVSLSITLKIEVLMEQNAKVRESLARIEGGMASGRQYDDSKPRNEQ